MYFSKFRYIFSAFYGVVLPSYNLLTVNMSYPKGFHQDKIYKPRRRIQLWRYFDAQYRGTKAGSDSNTSHVELWFICVPHQLCHVVKSNSFVTRHISASKLNWSVKNLSGSYGVVGDHTWIRHRTCKERYIGQCCLPKDVWYPCKLKVKMVGVLYCSEFIITKIS